MNFTTALNVVSLKNINTIYSRVRSFIHGYWDLTPYDVYPPLPCKPAWDLYRFRKIEDRVVKSKKLDHRVLRTFFALLFLRLK